MNFRPVYLDSSEIIKLVVREPESDALLAALEPWPDRVSVALVRVDVHRALRRSGQTKAAYTRADEVLDSLVLIRLDDAGVAVDEGLRVLHPGVPRLRQ